MISFRDITDAGPDQLPGIKNQLIVEKMKMEKFFSVFLDQSKMDDQDTNSPEWVTYREMLKSYERINQLLKSTDYYIKHRV